MRDRKASLTIVLSLWCVCEAVAQPIIVDNSDPQFTILNGTWNSGAYGAPYGADYLWALTSSAGGGPAEAAWRPSLVQSGEYEIAVHYVSGPNRATDAPYTVHHAGGDTTVQVNQQIDDSTWVPLGTFTLDAGTSGFVTLTNSASPTVVIADAVRFRSTEGLVFHDDPLIRFGGALFADSDGHAMRLDRINPALFADAGDLYSPAVAVLTSGVTVRFRTDSPNVRATFNHLSYVITEGTGYVVFQDGVFDHLSSDLEIVDAVSDQPGTPVTYEIVCPSYDEVTFEGLELASGTSLLPLTEDRRPRYFAFGDSITHGAQLDANTKGDSTKSYPWVLAATRGWELFNLAVGGSKVTPAFGEMLSGEQADIITILWGLNDKSKDNDLALYASKYGELLDNLRVSQPSTPIYCITLTTCSYEGPGTNGYTLDDYRDAVAGIVSARQAAGDCHLHLLRGEELTTLADLSDGAHLSVAGAVSFASNLAGLIEPPWGDLNNDGAWNGDDWQLFANCLAGPGSTVTSDLCIGLDLDCDADVDLREFAAFQSRCGR